MLYNIIQKYIIGKTFDKTNIDQCFDLASAYWHELFGHGLRGEGAADIPFKNKDYFNSEATVHVNTPEFLAKPGMVVVFNRNYGAGYGHVAVVLSATLNNITVIDQNWLGGGWTSGPERGGTGWEKATIRTHNYDFPMWFIEPKYKPVSANNKKKDKPKVVNKAKKKPIKLNYIRDEVRGYRLPNRGYKPKGIV